MNPISKRTFTRSTSKSGQRVTIGADYTLNLFKRHFEKCYTTDLEQYKFDKTECKSCVHNAANYNLFAEHNGCGHCTNRKCLEAKNAAHVAKETEKLLKSDPKLVVARPYYGSRNDMALQKLDKKGHEIKELDYNVSAREFPKAPEAPKKEQYHPSRKNTNKRCRHLSAETRNTPKRWKNSTARRRKAG